MEYTKGEWKLTQVASGTITVHADNFTIARLECYGPAQRLQETMANAHLISAAPDMCEALKEMTPYLSYLDQNNLLRITSMIRKALTKAEINR